MTTSWKCDWLLLLIPIAIFTVLRLPAILHQPGGQDEQFFAVPGYTVWQEGIPRIPYFPARERTTFFENADRCLMALPPGLFYCQAPFFAIFPAGYPTARLPLLLAAWIAIALTFCLARMLGAGSECALISACIVAISRPLLFTGTIARPDLLCVILGIGAIIIGYRSYDQSRLWHWSAVGVLCGLSCLMHPFGSVFCIQSVFAVLITSGAAKIRFGRLLVLVLSAVLLISLWLPLIIRFPYEFRSQFFSNVVDRAGPGLPSRLLWPFPSLIHHSRLLWELAGPWQYLLFAISAIAGSIIVLRSRRSDPSWRIVALVWSSIYLTATVAGLHPTKGYWVYSTVLVLVVLAAAVTRYSQSQSVRRLIMIISLVVMLPGAGLRTSWIYLRHWGDPQYHAPTFIRSVLKDFPMTGLYLSDLSYVFDLYLTGRATLLLKDRADYADQVDLNYDYIFVTWEGKDAAWAEQYGAKPFRQEGSRSPSQACYVDIFEKATLP